MRYIDFPMTIREWRKRNFNDVASPIIGLINALLGPLLGIVGAAGAIFCVVLGVKFAKAEEQQDREKAKQALKNAIIGSY